MLQSLIGNALGLLTGSMFSDPKVAASFVPVLNFIKIMKTEKNNNKI